MPSGLNAAFPVNDLTVIGNSDHDGTLIRFKADPEIFQETTEYEFEVLQKRLREQAFLNAGLMIRLNDLRNPENEIVKNTGMKAAFRRLWIS